MIELKSERTIVIGVVADSHVPDRVNSLHPSLLPELRKNGVQYVFHAGDISTPRVLDELSSLGPVYAVAGNRDWTQPSLPRHRMFCINGVVTLLTHGHVNPYHYWLDKGMNFLDGYRFDRYANRLSRIGSTAKLIIFGHSHHVENYSQGDQLFFNPGSSSIVVKPDHRLTFGIIRVHPDGNYMGEIIALEGSMLRFGKWIEQESNL